MAIFLNELQLSCRSLQFAFLLSSVRAVYFTMYHRCYPTLANYFHNHTRPISFLRIPRISGSRYVRGDRLIRQAFRPREEQVPSWETNNIDCFPLWECGMLRQNTNTWNSSLIDHGNPKHWRMIDVQVRKESTNVSNVINHTQTAFKVRHGNVQI